MTEIKVVCQSCGKELKAYYTFSSQDGELLIEINQCKSCNRLTYERGWKEGVAEYLKEKGENQWKQ